MTDAQPINPFVPPEKIIEAVSRATGVPRSDLLGLSKTQRILTARMVAMYALREVAGWSYPEIARYFERDHTTAMLACQRVPVQVQPAALAAFMESLATITHVEKSLDSEDTVKVELSHG